MDINECLDALKRQAPQPCSRCGNSELSVVGVFLRLLDIRDAKKALEVIDLICTNCGLVVTHSVEALRQRVEKLDDANRVP